jgi:elongator complex protein 2
MTIPVKLLHHGAAASSSSKALVCIPSQQPQGSTEIVYASHAMLNVARQTQVITRKKQEAVWTVYQTLRTQTKESATATNTVATATAKRVITSVAHLLQANNDSTTTTTLNVTIVCGFSDGTITSWSRAAQSTEWTERVLRHESICETTSWGDDGGRSVTDISGRVLDHDNNGRLLVVACTSAGSEYYEFGGKDGDVPRQPMVHHQVLVASPCNAVQMHVMDEEDTSIWILVGTAAPRHNKIHIFWTQQEPNGKLHYCGSLTGHEDWITCFDWFRLGHNGVHMLASGSQDAKVRLWKFTSTKTTTAPMMVEATGRDTPTTTALESNDNDSEEDVDEEEEEEGEARLEVVHNNYMTSVTLEALLIGHEERVTSISWHPNPKPIYGKDLILITSSMDRQILIWAEHENGVWTPISRVGSAGGILGGSIGSTLLGFVNVQLEPKEGRWLLGHGFGGALYFFSCQQTKENPQGENPVDTIEERAALFPWRAQPCITGHFEGVTDLCWEAESGEYLLTTSNDQTCRLWAPIASADEAAENKDIWIEIARPQVHGYDLSAVASLSTLDHPHLLVSGADEKELRAFDATNAFLRLQRLVSGEDPASDDPINRVDRAYIPSLGLSTKATAADGAEEDTSEVSEANTQLPLERDLGAVSLWPEIRKLYGHNSELARLSSTVSARTASAYSSSEYAKELLVASSAKARDVEDACIRLWNVEESRCAQVLTGGHRSTVAAIAFSPDGKYLASSGKDRRLCVWRRTHKGDSSAEKDLFYLASAVDSAHKRIIWGVHFCPFEPNILASGSRDGSVKSWRITDSLVDGKMTVTMKEIVDFSPMATTSNGKPEAVTSLAFAPLGISGTYDAILALGLENGLIELWKVPLNEGSKAELLTCFSPQLCHIATVTKLAWRPHRDNSMVSGETHMTLASASSDHGCRIFDIALPN